MMRYVQSDETLHHYTSREQHDKIISYTALQVTDYSYYWDMEMTEKKNIQNFASKSYRNWQV